MSVELDVVITKEDGEKADMYISNTDCLFATACKRLFPETKVSVGSSCLTLGEMRFDITSGDPANLYHNNEDGWMKKANLELLPATITVRERAC